MEFKIKFKRPNHWFWETRKLVGITHMNKNYTYNEINADTKQVGVVTDNALDQAIFTFSDGTEERMPEWSKCQLILKEDYFKAARESEEKRKAFLAKKNQEQK